MMVGQDSKDHVTGQIWPQPSKPNARPPCQLRRKSTSYHQAGRSNPDLHGLPCAHRHRPPLCSSLASLHKVLQACDLLFRIRPPGARTPALLLALPRQLSKVRQPGLPTAPGIFQDLAFSGPEERGGQDRQLDRVRGGGTRLGSSARLSESGVGKAVRRVTCSTSGLRSPLGGRAFPGELDPLCGSLRRAEVRAPLEPTSFHPIPELGDELCSLL